jgi:hypothetical protein
MAVSKINDELELVDESTLNPPDEVEVEEASDPLAEEYYPVEYSISSYGADYPVDGLVKRINNGSIYIPKFQRSYVWNVYRASRFIESLLLGLPVPAIFLSKEHESSKMLVIDGQQRLRTLQYYCNGVFEPTDRAFKLRGVQTRFQGASYKTLNEDDRLRLDDSIVHAIIVKQEAPDEDHNHGSGPSSIYHIFERLNTGGVLLQPQEIRSCIFHGKFIELLDTLNQDTNWRALFGKVSSRMRDRELILRFLALFFDAGNYAKPMKEFLNRFAHTYRSLDDAKAAMFTELFKAAIRVVHDSLGAQAFRTTRAINAALFDAVMVGTADRIAKGSITEPEVMKERYASLLSNDQFKLAISAGTTDDAAVVTRLNLAKAAFGDVP